MNSSIDILIWVDSDNSQPQSFLVDYVRFCSKPKPTMTFGSKYNLNSAEGVRSAMDNARGIVNALADLL
jgi:hypothetical protein